MIEIEGKDISQEFEKDDIRIHDRIGIIYKNKEEQICFEKGKIYDITIKSVDLVDYLTYNTREDTIGRGESTHKFQRDSSKITVTDIEIYKDPVEFHVAMNDIIDPINKQRRLHNEAIEEGKEGKKIELLKNFYGDGGYLRKALRHDATAFRS